MAQQKPIILSVDNKQHLPLAQGDTLSVASIPLSSDEGNLIQAREDGLYYGITAPADISRQYVSASKGNDTTGDGTRSKPWKTVQRAIDVIASRQASGSYVIYLRAGETFSLVRNNWLGNGTFSVQFTFYDDPKYGDAYDRNGYWVSCAQDLTRPTLMLDTYKTAQGLVEPTGLSSTPRLDQVDFRGINVTIGNSAGATTGGGWFFYCDRMVFCGAVCNVTATNQAFGSANSITLWSADFTLSGGAAPFIADFGPSLFGATVITPGEENADPLGEFPTCIGKTANFATVLKPENAMALSSYDKATKTLFGWNANWDIFG